MSGYFAIAVSRSSGSGGKEVARKIAEKFGISFYDKEILTEAAQRSGLNPTLFHEKDEKRANSFLYSVAMGSQIEEAPISQKLFMAQFDAIQKLAESGSCVFLGRCADYALRDYPNLVSVFVHAPLEYRIKQTMELYSMDEKKARNFVSKTDKDRSGYYSFYSGKRWGDIDNYHLCIDSSCCGPDGTAEAIKYFAETKLGLR